MYKIKLSPYAKIFYNEWLLDPSSSAYNVVIDQTFHGNFDPKRLESALFRYISEHVILNSHVQNIAGEPCWAINDRVLKLEYIDKSLSQSELLSYVHQNFGLHDGPLYRFRLLHVKDGVYRFIAVMHHLVIDGNTAISGGVFEAISNYYNDANYTARYSLDEQIELISDLTKKLDNKLEKYRSRYKEFWRKQLSDIENISLIFLKGGENHKQTTKESILEPVGEINFVFSSTESEKLNKIKLKYGVSPYVYGQCILAILLYRYTGLSSLAISYPIAIREGINFIYGAQINTNLIPYQFNNSTTILDLFNQNRDFFKLTLRDEIKLGYYPIWEIIHENNNKRLLNIYFIQTLAFRECLFKFDGIAKAVASTKLTVDGVTEDRLVFEYDVADALLNCRIRYDKKSFNEELLHNCVAGYKKIFSEILEDLINEKIKPISSLHLLDQKQYQQIGYDHNKTEKKYPKAKTIHQFFEEQVLRTPDNIAVVFEDIKLTYQELNNKANRLANYLIQNYDIKPDNLIGLCLDRSEQMIIAILGILKAGAAYVPIDPNYPSERVGYILEDTKAKIIIVEESVKLKASGNNQNKIIKINSDTMRQALSIADVSNPITNILATNLVYVLYTSGTTGKPKGVMLEHSACVNRILEMIRISQIIENNKVLFKTNYMFDVSFSDIFITLLSGASLFITKEVFDIEEIASKLKKHSVDVCHFTPSQFEIMTNIKGFNLFETIKVLHFSGEALDLKILRNLNKNIRCINYYGPTETGEITFDSCLLHYSKPLIGYPIGNAKVYILDKNLMLLPKGVVGELYLGGDGIARGYLNQSELTAEKFIQNPFQTQEEKLKGINGKLYKTGDLVRMLLDGNIEYIGRNDNQIKIRGYRIELEEIENKLMSYPEVKRAVVLAKTYDNGKCLVAYYVATNELDQERLLDYLSPQLPEYMIPSIFVRIPNLPLTTNGKLDEKALPEPNFVNLFKYVAPRNELEKKVCEIYAEIFNLPVQQVGIINDFFQMGGDSISAIRLASQIRQQLGYNITIRDIFNCRKVEQLVINILANNTQKEPPIEKIKYGGYQGNIQGVVTREYSDKVQKNTEIESVYLANNLQQGFIYHAIKQGKIDDAYVSHSICEYEVPIDKDKFKTAWRLTQQKYPSLRLRFAWDNELIQIIDKKQELDFRYIDLNNLTIQTQIADIIATDRKEYYDPQKGNLIRVYLIKSKTNTYTCVCSIHHIILDGWSLPLLFNDAHEFYSQLLVNRQSQIMEDMAYKNAQKYLQEHKNEDQTYWNNQLKQLEERANLNVLLKQSAENQNKDIKKHTLIENEQEEWIKIAGAKFIKLKSFCQTNAITINSVIQYAWHKLLHIYGNSNTTIVGTVVSGRNIPINDIEKSVGLFLNTLPLVFVHNTNLPILEQIKTIQNSINEINSRTNVNLANLQINGERLFDSLIVYENYPLPKNNINIKSKNIWGISKVDYPLALFVYEVEEDINKEKNLMVRLKYAAELFEKETINNLLSRLLFFIEQILENPRKKILSYLDQKEHQLIAFDFNKTKKEYPHNQTLCQLFTEQVKNTPNNIAVIFNDICLTYQELDAETNKLSLYLKSLGIKEKESVALYLKRSLSSVIAIVSIIKIGAIYIPLDPQYPQARVRYMAKDSGCNFCITDKELFEQCKAILSNDNDFHYKINTLCISDAKNIESVAVDYNNKNALSAAYIMYTSGSTGEPKGIKIHHRGIIRVVKNTNYIEFTSQDRIAHATSISFDISTVEIWGALLNGSTLVIVPQETLTSFLELSELLHKQAVSVMCMAPVLFNTIVSTHYSALSQLRCLLICGEKLSPKNIPYFYENNKFTKLVNCYGPTESTSYATSFEIPQNWSASKELPIGKPIANTTAYVLDNHLQLLPIGAIGELCIGGDGLAICYNNKPELTHDKFIDIAFGKENKKTQIYRTGDLVRMLPDGNLEFIGRNDFQIKIRGYRVELGEIENRLIRYPGIKQVVVLVKEHITKQDGDKYLVAYYIADERLEKSKMMNYLSTQLPSYMIPEYYVRLEKFPLSTSGKLDRRALPVPELIKNDHLAPNTRQEEIICEVFGSVLGLQKIGVNDDFFSLGGNSISAIRLVSILQKNFDIKIADIFNLRTPKKLAESSKFGKNYLQYKLDQVRAAYQNKQGYETVIDEKRQKDLDSYRQAIEELSTVDISVTKPIQNVLLTGSTGYLGCNILNQLLELTNYKVYLPVRASSQIEAIERVNRKYQFYFDQHLDEFINNRVFVFKADLEQKQLGILPGEYHDLTTNIDSVIHTAALVKHYGEYNTFYSANVTATINMLEFAKLSRLKDFHYISTYSVLKYMPMLNEIITTCTEDDLPIPSEVLDNIYAQTKLLGEHQATKYQYLGLNCNIYRIGNLAFMLKNCRVQENIDDNAFHNWLKYLFTIKRSTKTINMVEISPADLTAQAIVKIFDKENLTNQTFHVFNPHFFNMDMVLKNKEFKILPEDQFIDHVANNVHNEDHHDLLVKFLLYQGWLDWWEEKSVIPVKILLDKTQGILERLGFKWSPIANDIMYSYIESSKFG